MFEMITMIFEYIVVFVVSRPQELPLQPLAERYVNLSIHTAPIKQTLQSFHFANGRIDIVWKPPAWEDVAFSFRYCSGTAPNNYNRRHYS